MIEEEGGEAAMHVHTCKQPQVLCINKFLEGERFTDYSIV